MAKPQVQLGSAHICVLDRPVFEHYFRAYQKRQHHLHDKMALILQMTFLNVFFCMEIALLWLKFQLNLF